MTSKRLNRTIMHVDDDPSLLRVVAGKLSASGYEVISVEDPREAVSKMRETGARLLLLDIDMPYVNGMELLKKVKQEDGGIQVVMLSGLVSMSTALQSMRWGAEACVFKPINDFGPLLKSIEATFEKIDRWWTCVEELRKRKTTEMDTTLVLE